uniref:Uncharacterized protein n=1 Tax=Papilio xuthus TaxID=66420 RepID=I4DLL9_PAPXU|nr:unknown unsecreted protein [Papilio xuthus]
MRPNITKRKCVCQLYPFFKYSFCTMRMLLSTVKFLDEAIICENVYRNCLLKENFSYQRVVQTS